MYGEGDIVREVCNSFSSRLICKMLSMLSPAADWMNIVHFPQSSYHGYLGAMVHTVISNN